jgi:glutamate/tyrosine decarboxylase-like PLP-dependent enzyme
MPVPQAKQPRRITTVEAAIRAQTSREKIIRLLHLGAIRGEFHPERRDRYSIDPASLDEYVTRRDAVRAAGGNLVGDRA